MTFAIDRQTIASANINIGFLGINGTRPNAGTCDISFYNAGGLSVPAYVKPGGLLYQSGNFFESERSTPTAPPRADQRRLRLTRRSSRLGLASRRDCCSIATPKRPFAGQSCEPLARTGPIR